MQKKAFHRRAARFFAVATSWPDGTACRDNIGRTCAAGARFGCAPSNAEWLPGENPPRSDRPTNRPGTSAVAEKPQSLDAPHASYRIPVVKQSYRPPSVAHAAGWRSKTGAGGTSSKICLADHVVYRRQYRQHHPTEQCTQDDGHGRLDHGLHFFDGILHVAIIKIADVEQRLVQRARSLADF